MKILGFLRQTLKIKVSFWDKRVRKTFYGFLAAVSIIAQIVFLFIEIETKYKGIVGLGVCCVLGVIIYVFIWAHSNFRRSIQLKINNSDVEVKFGDLFSEGENDLTVIPFNEYFDTKVDDKVIAKKTLNGRFIEEVYEGPIEELDKLISDHAQEMRAEETPERRSGKKTKYGLGTVCNIEDRYLIVAFSRFDKDNRAYLGINDYINCLLNFWSEVDRVYAGRTVVLPLIGSGITRFKDYSNISEQELLELIVWTFKISRIKFTYPSVMKIVVHEPKKDKVNLSALKNLEP